MTDLTVRNLTVEGYLDAPNIRGCSKGLFLSREDLVANYPHPHRGWWAVVCNSIDSSSAEGELYMALLDEYEQVVWTDSGKAADLSNLLDRFQPLEEQIDEINTRLDSISESVNTQIEELTTLVDTLVETIESYGKDMVTDVTAIGTLPLSLSSQKINNLVRITGSVDFSQFDEERAQLATLWEDVSSGRINNGSERFNGVVDSSTITCEISDSEPNSAYDGILWLTDKKMFVAYTTVVRMDSDSAYITYYLYTTWDTANQFMQSIGVEAGLWQDKVYIYGGGVYVWSNSEGNLVLVSGTGQSLSNSIECQATSPLHFEIVPSGDGITLYGNIDKVSSSADGYMTAVDKAHLDELWEKYQDGDFGCTCDNQVNYADPIVELSYPDKVPGTGGTSVPVLSYSQEWSKNGTIQTPITSGAVVSYELLENFMSDYFTVTIDESTGVVTARVVSTSAGLIEYNLCTVKVTVLLNNHVGTAEATIIVTGQSI